MYGPVGPNSSAYSVQVDNGSEALLNATKEFYRAQQILFYAGNLGKGQHTLRVQSGAAASGELAIDYANVYSAPSLGGRLVPIFGFLGTVLICLCTLTVTTMQ